ncbi:MAG: hypothetical protein WA102_05025 [Candidatus Methanoperedens sp.]
MASLGNEYPSRFLCIFPLIASSSLFSVYPKGSSTLSAARKRGRLSKNTG